MSANLAQQSDRLFLLRIRGELKKSELDAMQDEIVAKMTARPVHLLVVLEEFTGWERSEAWADTEFFYSHQGDFGKIAVVGPPHWEAEVLAFTGAGIRQGPVKLFPETGEAEARAWLAG
jgi:hypothetical protein